MTKTGELAAIKDQAKHNLENSEFSDQTESFYASYLAGFGTVDFDTWLSKLRDYIAGKDNLSADLNDGDTGPVDEWYGADERFLLRAIVEVLQDSDFLCLDVCDLTEGGWFEEGQDPQESAIEDSSWAMAYGSPPIIVTEGSTDSRSIFSAIKVLRPHLVSYLRFLDFSVGNEGSAVAGVRTLKNLAAAGVANRVLLLLDNDTAARDAARFLDRSQLPDRFQWMHYRLFTDEGVAAAGGCWLGRCRGPPMMEVLTLSIRKTSTCLTLPSLART